MLIRRLWYFFVLAALVGLAYYLPKAVQNTEGFTPLAKQMADQLASHKEPTAAPVLEPAFPPAISPEVSAPVAEAPASAPAAPDTAKVESEVEAPPAMTTAAAADLTPFVEAMAAGDFAKAAALLELLKSGLPPEKYQTLASNVEAARKRETAMAAAAAAPAPAPAPVVVAASKPDPAAVQAQAAMLESLRMIQQTQKETAQMLAQLREKPAATEAAEPVAAAKPAAAAPPAVVSGPLPGSLTILFSRDSSIISPAEAEKLTPVLEALKSNPTLKVELRGFADKSGNSEYNLGLSRARATAVQDVFRRANIEGERVVLQPMGDFSAGDATAGESASAMRKVEVILVR